HAAAHAAAAGRDRGGERQRPGRRHAHEPATDLLAPAHAARGRRRSSAPRGPAGLLLARRRVDRQAPPGAARAAPDGPSEQTKNRVREVKSMSVKNGNGRGRGNGKVRVAVVGVGNCASSLIQGVQYYRDASPKDFVPVLMRVDLGGYHISDIEFVAAFDVDKTKVGKDLSEAIWEGQNNTVKFSDVPHLGVKVERGMTHDGIGKYLSELIQKAPGET